MVIANNDELEGGGNSPDVLVVTTFHFLLAKDFYHKSDVCLHSSINRQNTPTHSLKIHIFCDIFFGAVGVESFEKRKFDFLYQTFLVQEERRILNEEWLGCD